METEINRKLTLTPKMLVKGLNEIKKEKSNKISV